MQVNNIGATLRQALEAAKQPAHKEVRVERVKSVNMPGAVYELTRDFAGTMHMPHDAFMAMLWTNLAAQLDGAMNAVIASRDAEGDERELEAKLAVAQETRHHKYQLARLQVDAIVGGSNIPLVI